MSGWTYQHESGHQPAGCEDPAAVELSIDSCEGSVDITVRYPRGIVLCWPTGEVQEEDMIASIHLPQSRVLEAVEMLLRCGGVDLGEAITHLTDVREELMRPVEIGPDAVRHRPEQ